MIDTKAKRAAAIGYGLSFLLVLPPAGGISIEDAGHALSAYQFDLPPLVPIEIPLSIHTVEFDSSAPRARGFTSRGPSARNLESI